MLHVYGWVAWVDISVLGAALLPEIVAMVSGASSDGGNVLIEMWVGVGGRRLRWPTLREKVC